MEPASKPGAMTSASPTSPTSVARRIPRDTRSPTAERRRTTCSGTVPAIIAATLESMRVSATWTTPTPSVRSSKPTSALDASSRRVTRRLCPRAASTVARIAPAARKRLPAEKRGGSVSTTTLIPRYVDPQTK